MAHNSKVYVAARSQEKVEVAIKDLKDITGKEAIFLKLDLADLKSVKAAAEEYLRFVFRRKTGTHLTLSTAKRPSWTFCLTMRQCIALLF